MTSSNGVSRIASMRKLFEDKVRDIESDAKSSKPTITRSQTSIGASSKKQIFLKPAGLPTPMAEVPMKPDSSKASNVMRLRSMFDQPTQNCAADNKPPISGAKPKPGQSSGAVAERLKAFQTQKEAEKPPITLTKPIKEPEIITTLSTGYGVTEKLTAVEIVPKNESPPKKEIHLPEKSSTVSVESNIPSKQQSTTHDKLTEIPIKEPFPDSMDGAKLSLAKSEDIKTPSGPAPVEKPPSPQKKPSAPEETPLKPSELDIKVATLPKLTEPAKKEIALSKPLVTTDHDTTLTTPAKRIESTEDVIAPSPSKLPSLSADNSLKSSEPAAIPSTKPALVVQNAVAERVQVSQTTSKSEDAKTVLKHEKQESKNPVNEPKIEQKKEATVDDPETSQKAHSLSLTTELTESEKIVSDKTSPNMPSIEETLKAEISPSNIPQENKSSETVIKTPTEKTPQSLYATKKDEIPSNQNLETSVKSVPTKTVGKINFQNELNARLAVGPPPLQRRDSSKTQAPRPLTVVATTPIIIPEFYKTRSMDDSQFNLESGVSFDSPVDSSNLIPVPELLHRSQIAKPRTRPITILRLSDADEHPISN